MQTLTWFSSDFSWRLTLTLVHFLWQGCVIGLAACVIDRFMRKSAPAVRYGLHLTALVVMAACLPVTFTVLEVPQIPHPAPDIAQRPAAAKHASSETLRASTANFELDSPESRSEPIQPATPPDGVVREIEVDAAAMPNGAAGQSLAPLTDRSMRFEPWADRADFLGWLALLAPQITLVYFAGVIVMALRLTNAWRGVVRLRCRAQPLDDVLLLTNIAELARRIGVRIVPVVRICQAVSVPIVIGVVRPVILLPAAIVSGLPPAQLQALLAHELAHVRRWDPIVNVVQRWVEVGLFFHPAVWYVSRRVSIEREYASDDVVVKIGIPRLAYADALVRVAEMTVRARTPQLAVATLAASGNRPAEFTRRVMRLLSSEPTVVRSSPWSAMLVWAVVSAALALPMLLPAWSASRSTLQAATAAVDAEPVGREIKDFKLWDAAGAARQLDEFAAKKLVVVAFLGSDCPLANRYGPRLEQLARQYQDRGVAWIGVNSNTQDSPTDVARYGREHGITFPLLKDPGNRVADQFGATRTPEVFVLDEKRIIRYWGGIDDQFGVGFARPDATQAYLTAALDELLASRPVTQPHVASVGCHIGRVSRKAATGSITYGNQVSRILQQRCVECHRAGGIGPFALDSYADVSPWAETIREVVMERRMPPWHADPKYGRFVNDCRMPDEEVRQLCQWIDNGLPEGSAAELPTPRRFVDGWSLGPPDQVVEMREPFEVSPQGTVSYQYFTVDPGLTEGKWVRASEVRPGVRSVVHHVIVFVNAPGSDPILEERGVGFETVGSYVPGAPPMQLDPGVARYVPAGSKFVFQLHYTPDGKPRRDQTKIGLYFADPATIRRTMQTGVAANLEFAIPPHAAAYQITAGTRISHDTEIHALIPHMHFRGKSFRFVANYPNGSREILLDVPDFDFNWQHTYRLATPKLLPEGTLLRCIASFDNSRHNRSNPDPTIEVKWGEQTWEEMMIGYFEGVYLNQDLTRAEPRCSPVGDGTYRVHFAYRPDRPVRTVNVAGTFNEWNTTSHPLSGPDQDGEYAVDVVLPAGPHRYKFVVDGDYWSHDPASRILTGIFHESFFVAGPDSSGKAPRQP